MNELDAVGILVGCVNELHPHLIREREDRPIDQRDDDVVLVDNNIIPQGQLRA